MEGYDVRLEWGLPGVELLARDCAVVVIVDVLSFCTTVDVAVGHGLRVLPLRWRSTPGLSPADPEADGFGAAADGTPAHATVTRASASDDPPPSAARDAAPADPAQNPAVGDAVPGDPARDAVAGGAVLAGRRGGPGPTLAPSSMLTVPPGTLVALPSPNGATLCAATEGYGAAVFAGCLRNRAAVAGAAVTAAHGGAIGVVPAGERWPDGTMRVAGEDALGAGAIVAALQQVTAQQAVPAVQRDPAAPRSEEGDPAATRVALTLSPEARLAAAQFAAASDDLAAILAALVSARELTDRGYGDDVAYAAELDVSTAVPRLVDGILTG